MFEEARLKLTGWYLVIIMTISLGFSAAVYMGANEELMRFDNAQRIRQLRVDSVNTFLIQQGLPVPPGNETQGLESLALARKRIVCSLAIVNLAILVVSGLGGYFLAGLTLDPISKMVKEQKEFISNASHELRTPLTSLKTEIEVALRDEKMTVKDAKILLASNLEDVNSMQKLSNYLLKLHRFESGDADIKLKKMDLASVISKVVKEKTPYAAQKNIKIITKLSKVDIKGNEEYIAELTGVLVENAIKYSGKAKKIEVTTTKEGTFIVRDFGVGIAEKDLPHIFDRFYRADTARSKSSVEGYGLGLSIAKSVADRLGVEIKVKSQPGKGSQFCVQFPVAS